MQDYPDCMMRDGQTKMSDTFGMSKPSYAPGPAMDTVSMVDPMPEPTNATIKQAETAVSKQADWKKPRYNYKRKAAEETATEVGLAQGVAVAAIVFGGYYLLRSLDYSFDASTMGANQP